MKNIRKFETTSEMENAVLEETSLVYNLETNGILSLPLGEDWVEEITFYISGCEYKAFSNMTWKEWIDTSDMNDIDASCVSFGCDNYWRNDENNVLSDLSAEEWCLLIGYNYVTKDGVRVSLDDIIIPDFNYGVDSVMLH